MAVTAFGPLGRVVGVKWASGVFVVVQVFCAYEEPDAANRSATLVLTFAGEELGGEILGQKEFHEPEVTDPGPDETAHPKRSQFVWLLKFSRVPQGVADLDHAFRVTLAGTIMVIDETSPPPLQDYFCGTTTSGFTFTIGVRFVERPGFDPQPILTGTTTLFETSPAGGGEITFTYDLGNGSIEDVGQTVTQQSSSTSVWYQDGFGNFINTHVSCDELGNLEALPPLTNSAVRDGFDEIRCEVYPRRGYISTESATWTWDTAPGQEIVVPNPESDAAIGGPQYICFVDRLLAGLNSDFLPIFDDLPDGPYDFKLATLFFENLPPKPTDVDAFSVKGLYPTAPLFAEYFVEVATTDPYVLHVTPDINDRGGTPIHVGTAPPANLSFD